MSDNDKFKWSAVIAFGIIFFLGGDRHGYGIAIVIGLATLAAAFIPAMILGAILGGDKAFANAYAILVVVFALFAVKPGANWTGGGTVDENCVETRYVSC